MSEARKVWLTKDGTGMAKEKHGASRDKWGMFTEPAILVPIDDESLPHPADGREWKTRYGVPIQVESAPVWSRGFPSGKYVSLVRHLEGGVEVIPTAHLHERERKPEPEHRPWCYRDSPSKLITPPHCRCHIHDDPRSGVDRREGERRSLNEPEPNYVATAVRNAFLSGRRSGTDRRKS